MAVRSVAGVYPRATDITGDVIHGITGDITHGITDGITDDAT